MRFVVRRVVVLGIARNRLNIRFGHCTSCLFDNSSVKLCKHDTPFHSCRKAGMMSRVWGRHAPTRSLRKCRRIGEVKSRMDRKFSRIENLWPRDGSCPLPLRSKRIFNKCFRIVKTQKISREFRCSCMLIAVCSERSSYPCLCSGVGWKAGITFGRLMKFSRYCPRKRKMPLRSRRRILSG